jgi:hypothetical protein
LGRLSAAPGALFRIDGDVALKRVDLEHAPARKVAAIRVMQSNFMQCRFNSDFDFIERERNS